MRVKRNDAVIQMDLLITGIGAIAIALGILIAMRTRKKPEKKWDYRDGIPYPVDGPTKR